VGNEDILKGEKLLIVDDESEILEVLEDELDVCSIDFARAFEEAKEFLDTNDYDAAILDIMGVSRYDLLRIATEKGIPSLMLTAHALSPDNLVKSIKEGASTYVPKERIADIKIFLMDVLKARQQGIDKHGDWFVRLKPFFDTKFGPGWREKTVGSGKISMRNTWQPRKKFRRSCNFSPNLITCSLRSIYMNLKSKAGIAHLYHETAI